MSTVEPDGTWQYAQAVWLARGRPRWVELALLHDEDERALGVATGSDLRFGRGDLAERAADVDRAGSPDGLVRPGDGFGQRPVHLEDARAIAISLEAPR